MLNEEGKGVYSREKHSRTAELSNFIHKKVNEKKRRR